MPTYNQPNFGIGTTEPATLLHVASGVPKEASVTIGEVGAPNDIRFLTYSGEAPFSIGPWGADFNGTFDDVLYIGFNYTAGGGKIVQGVPNLGLSIESNYEETPGAHHFEYSLNGLSPDGLLACRPMAFTCDRETFQDMNWEYKIGDTGSAAWFRVRTVNGDLRLEVNPDFTKIAGCVKVPSVIATGIVVGVNGLVIDSGLEYTLGVASNPSEQVVRFGGQNVATLEFDPGHGYALVSMDSHLERVSIAPVWDDPARAFTVLQIDATNTQSAGGSRFVDFRIDGDPRFYVDEDGSTYVAGKKVLGARGAAVPDATGGEVIDVEARAAVNALLARLRDSTGHGLIETQ